MIYQLSQYILDIAKAQGWEEAVSWLRIFSYVSVRAVGAALTAFALCMFLGPLDLAQSPDGLYG